MHLNGLKSFELKHQDRQNEDHKPLSIFLLKTPSFTHGRHTKIFCSIASIYQHRIHQEFSFNSSKGKKKVVEAPKKGCNGLNAPFHT